MIQEQLPVLLVLAPMLIAACLVFVPNERVARAIAVLVTWACFGMAIQLLVTARVAPISYEMGGWTPPLGIEYRVDAFNSLLLTLIAGVASVVLPFGPGSAKLAIPKRRRPMYYAAFLLTMSGLLGIAITGDLFNVFVFLEISSLGSYSLIALGTSRRALMAAFSYLIMGTIGGTFILLGIGLTYQLTGSLNMADIATILPDKLDTSAARVALALLLVGGAIKGAVFPLHQWLPNAYSYAPSAVSAFLAGTGTKVSLYVMARAVFVLYTAGFAYGALHLERVLVPLALAGMFFGSLAAVFQTNLKRLLAYSSIAQVGYIVLGMAIANADGLTGSVVHMVNHGVIKSGLFLTVACITAQAHTSTIEDLSGLAQRMPLTAAAWVVGGLAMIGVPATAGFVSKWYFVVGALEKGWYGVALAIVLSSLLAVVYVWRVVEVFYFRSAPEDSTVREAPVGMLGPTWVLICASVVFGLWTPWTVGTAKLAAAALLGGVP